MPPGSLGRSHTITAYGRSRILASAAKLFARHGFNGVSISDVADAAGVVKSAIYHHFPSKEALYLAVLNDVVHSSHEQMVAAATGANWRERLSGAVHALGRLMGPRSHVFGLIMEAMAQSSPRGNPPSAAVAAGLRREFVSTISQEIGAGIAAGDIRPLDQDLASFCLIGIIAAALQAYPSGFDESQVDFAIDLFLEGASPRRAPASPGE